MMRYDVLVAAYRNLKESTGRLRLIATLAGLFRRTPASLLPEIVYLCQGKLAPDFAGLQLGLAEKLTAQAVAESTRSSPAQVTASLRRTGDLGSAA
jgi:DNA ligase-1